jgi:NADPH-dependent 2,4-dienoyl-CoA reductase/sulfur reductase-like enzyme
LAEKNGITFKTSTKITQIHSNNGKVQSIELPTEKIPTDILIMATGAKPALDFAKELIDTSSQGINTNVYLETSEKDVYAAGDVASYPYWQTGKRLRVEHM